MVDWEADFIHNIYSPGLLLIKDPRRRSMYFYMFHQADALCQSEQSVPD